jgi:hypothetical protein
MYVCPATGHATDPEHVDTGLTVQSMVCPAWSWLAGACVALSLVGCATGTSLSPLGQSRLEETRTVLHQVWTVDGNGRPEPTLRAGALPQHVLAEWRATTHEIILSPTWLQGEVVVPVRPEDSEAKASKQALDWTIPFSHEMGHALAGHTGARCRDRVPDCEHEADMTAVDVLRRGWGLPRDAAEFKVCVWLMTNLMLTRQGTRTPAGGHDPEKEFDAFVKETGRRTDCSKTAVAR